MAFKIAFVGSHGVGKTTLVYGLAARLKARDRSLEVLVEVARRCPLPLNEETSLSAQAWILHSQVADELAAEARYPVILCDRSVLDNYVYLLLAEGPQRPLEPFLEHWLSTYDLLVHVPIVDELVLDDGIRSTDRRFQRAIEERLCAELSERRVEVLRLHDRRREEWLEIVEERVLERTKPPQLELI